MLKYTTAQMALYRFRYTICGYIFAWQISVGDRYYDLSIGKQLRDASCDKGDLIYDGAAVLLKDVSWQKWY